MNTEEDCTYLYFNSSGKWKYEGRGRFPTYFGSGWQGVSRQTIVEENGRMPGVTGMAEGLVVVVCPDKDCENPFAYPRMLKPTRGYE